MVFRNCSNMLKIFDNHQVKTLALAGVFALGLIGFTRQPQPRVQIQSEKFLPPKAILNFTFGQRELMADLYWLRLIQDFDFCEKKIDQINCAGNGWVYHMLDLITELSPKFRMPLAVGPMMLSVVVSDIQGASLLFDKAVVRFPDDWPILYRAAYHALFEEKNNAKAAKLMELAAKKGAPIWIYSLSARLYTEAGQADFAAGLLKELEAAGSVNDAILQRIRDKLKK